MAADEITIRARQGAITWTPSDGWSYEPADLPTWVTDGHYILVVCDHDGMVRGVTPYTTPPLAVVLRLEADVAELVLALNDVTEDFAQRLSQRDGRAS